MSLNVAGRFSEWASNIKTHVSACCEPANLPASHPPSAICQNTSEILFPQCRREPSKEQRWREPSKEGERKDERGNIQQSHQETGQESRRPASALLKVDKKRRILDVLRQNKKNYHDKIPRIYCFVIYIVKYNPRKRSATFVASTYKDSVRPLFFPQ